MASWTIYTKPGCKPCNEAYKLLVEFVGPFDRIIVKPVKGGETAIRRLWLKERGLTTVPQIFKGDEEQEHIGGYDELKAYVQKHAA